VSVTSTVSNLSSSLIIVYHRLTLTSPADRRLTMSRVLLALAEVGQRHRDELCEVLRR